MDPLIKIPEELLNLIYQHCTVDELLSLSEVSVRWYQMIGQSKDFSKAVWVNVDDRFAEPSQEIVKILTNSERNYQNFKISELGNGMEIVSDSKRKWQRAKIDIQSYMQTRDFQKILSSFDNSICDLEIFDMDIQENLEECPENKNFAFLNLQRLYFGNISLNSIKPFVYSCQNLKVLIFKEISFSHTQDSCLKNLINAFFKSIKSLQKLQLPAEILNFMLQEIDELKFSLEYLCIDFPNDELLYLESFDVFLCKQNALSWIKLSDCSESQYVASILNSVNIKRLSLEYFDKDSQKFSTSELSNIVNSSIVQFDLECEGIIVEWMEPLFKILKNLNIIYLFHVVEEFLNRITSCCRTVRVVKYCSAEKSIRKLSSFAEIQMIEHKSFLEDCKL